MTVIFIAGAYVLPEKAAVQRRIAIAAPPGKVFAIVGDLRRFQEFSPWADLDPRMTVTVDGELGVGQSMAWTSAHPDVGSGSQKITAYEPVSHVVMALDWGGSQGESAFALVPSGEGTEVTWSFSTALTTPLDRWLGPLFDRSIGADYEKGLSRLKAAAEKP